MRKEGEIQNFSILIKGLQNSPMNSKRQKGPEKTCQKFKAEITTQRLLLLLEKSGFVFSLTHEKVVKFVVYVKGVSFPRSIKESS